MGEDMMFLSFDAAKEVWQVYSISAGMYVVYHRWASGGWTLNSTQPSPRNMMSNRVLEHKRDIFIAERLKWEQLWN